MSDMTFNKLEIIGDVSQISEVRSFLQGSPFEDGSERYIDFNKIIPIPSGIVRQDDINKWRWDNWGIGKNACKQWEDLPNTIVFKTEYLPVLELMKKLSSLFPDIEFMYGFDYANIVEATWDSYHIKDGVEVLIGQYDGRDCPPIFSKKEEHLWDIPF